jgi:hypothetical protein
VFISTTVQDENLTAGGAVDPNVRGLFAKSNNSATAVLCDLLVFL